MPQKLLDPIRKLPHQIQNLDIIKKLHDLTSGHHSDNLDYCLSSSYGALEGSKSLAFDKKLGLLAVGSENGCIKIYGAPGVVFTVQNEGPAIISMEFLQNEGRLVCAFEDGTIALFELDTSKGVWSCSSRVSIPRVNDQEKNTCLTVGLGVIYVGSTAGTLRQVAVKDGRMTVGDEILTSCTANFVLESVPIDKRTQLGVDSPIVSLEIQPEGNHLLIAYAGGCVAVAIPQPIPIQTPVHSAVVNGNAAPTAECEIVTPIAEDEAAPKLSEQATDDAPKETGENDKPEQEEVKVRLSVEENGAKQSSDTHGKEHSEKRTTLKFKSLTRSLRPTESQKPEKEVEPPLPVPPTPRISHLLVRDQPVEWATWRVTAVGTLSTEVTVAYGDGAFQVWPINATVSQQPSEPIIVSKRDPPSTPYGPMPCGAIKKIFINPSQNGGVLTVFSGGLPRPQFDNRHAVSVLQGHDQHVCFQFGSEVRDFILIPAAGDVPTETEAPAEVITKPVSPSASAALLVLTERELIAIDLTHPNWPTFNSPYLTCLDYSPVTAVAHIGEVPTSLIHRLQSAAQSGSTEVTTNPWPIWGGEPATEGLKFAENVGNDIVLLGHANGWVTLWLLGRGDTIHHLGTIPTAALFNPADLQQEQNGNACQALEEETWPPFKPVGNCSKLYRQFGDHSDSRLAVTQISVQIGNPMRTDDSLMPVDSLTVVIGGAAGQISTWTTGPEGTKPTNEVVLFEADVAKISANLLTTSDEAKYVWKDTQPIKTLEGPSPLLNATGLAFYPCGLVQMNPPAPVSAIALESSWNLLAVGSPLGFAIIDLLSRSVLHTVFTHTVVSATKHTKHVSTVQNAIVSRGKQFTATMRQSFRRLKNLRTSLSTPDKAHDETPAPAPTTTDDTIQPAENVAPVEKTAEETTPETQSTEKPKESTSEEVGKVESSEPAATVPAQDDGDHDETKTDVSPWAEQTEPTALSRDDFGVSGIRSLLFAHTYVVNPVATNPQQPNPLPTRSPSLWVGTGNGKALAYTLNWEGSSGPVNIYLIKELQLQHRSPIIRMCILDGSSHSPVTTNNNRQRISLEVPKPEDKEPEAPALSTENAQETEQTTATAPEADTAATTTTTTSAAAVAAAATNQPTIQETHQLLLCSEEQVKLFSLPSLRACHKHKFFDRLRLQHSLAHTKTGTTVSVKQSKETNEDADAAVATTTAAATTTTTAPTAVASGAGASTEPEPETKHHAPTTCHRKLVRGFGVQSFSCGSGDQSKDEWHVVATLLDGQIAILSLPNLRKIFKERECLGLSSGIVSVSSYSSNNIVVWFVGSQLLTAELGSKSNLVSLAIGSTPLVKIPLPEWMRPQKPVPTESVDTAAADSVQPATAAVALATEVIDAVASPQTNGNIVEEVVQNVTDTMENTVTGLNDVLEKTEQSILTGVQAMGDMTLDSIKDYWNGEGTVTVKTTESSMEKRTLVEAGKITTTVHEVQKVDGKVTKDDVVKIVSDNETEVPAIAGTS